MRAVYEDIKNYVNLIRERVEGDIDSISIFDLCDDIDDCIRRLDDEEVAEQLERSKWGNTN